MRLAAGRVGDTSSSSRTVPPWSVLAHGIQRDDNFIYPSRTPLIDIKTRSRSRDRTIEDKIDDGPMFASNSLERHDGETSRASISHPFLISYLNNKTDLSSWRWRKICKNHCHRGRAGGLRESRVADASKTAAAAAITDHNTSPDTSTNATSHIRLTGCTQNEAYERSLYITQ